MSMQGKHVAILVEQSYQEMEIWYPLYRMREEGIRVSCVGTGTMEVYPSKLGYPCKQDCTIHAVTVGEFDAVLIPGGWAPDFLRREPKMNRFVADMSAAGKIVASICHGGWMLVSADICRGKRGTSFFAIKHDLIHAGLDWVDEECVVDGNLITARKPDDLPAFTRALLDGLAQ